MILNISSSSCMNAFLCYPLDADSSSYNPSFAERQGCFSEQTSRPDISYDRMVARCFYRLHFC